MANFLGGVKYAQNKHENFAAKFRRKFRPKFRRTSSTPSAWLEIKISPLLSKLRRVQVGRFQHPATLLQRHSQTHELVDTLPHRPLLGRLIQDLVYLSGVDRIFNLGQVGPCSTLNQYGYRGNISSRSVDLSVCLLQSQDASYRENGPENLLPQTLENGTLKSYFAQPNLAAELCLHATQNQGGVSHVKLPSEGYRAIWGGFAAFVSQYRPKPRH